MAVDLRRIELFLAVAEDLHFTNAARRLNIAQPAISRAVRRLEDELGVALFTRHTRNVELTQAGRLFQRDSQAVLERLDRAIGVARAAATGDAGTLRVGYMDIALAGVLPDILKEFRTRYPDVSVVPKSSHTEQIAVDLLGRGIDVGFAMAPVEHTGLASFPVQSDPFVVVVPDTHRLATKDVVCLADLADEPLIMGRRDLWAPYLLRVESLFRAAGLVPRVVQEAETTESIFAFVAAGMGSTIYVERAFSLRQSGIAIRSLRDVSSTITTDLAWRADDDTPIVQNFIAVTREVTQSPKRRPMLDSIH